MVDARPKALHEVFTCAEQAALPDAWFWANFCARGFTIGLENSSLIEISPLRFKTSEFFYAVEEFFDTLSPYEVVGILLGRNNKYSVLFEHLKPSIMWNRGGTLAKWLWSGNYQTITKKEREALQEILPVVAHCTSDKNQPVEEWWSVFDYLYFLLNDLPEATGDFALSSKQQAFVTERVRPSTFESLRWLLFSEGVGAEFEFLARAVLLQHKTSPQDWNVFRRFPFFQKLQTLYLVNLQNITNACLMAGNTASEESTLERQIREEFERAFKVSQAL